MYVRLSLMMFLQWAVPGALVPLYSKRLTELGFSEVQVGWCAATQAVASVFASLFAGQVADRWVSAERALAACALLAGLDLWVLAGLTQPGPVFLATLLFWLMAGPVTLLGTTVCLTHLSHPERQFGRVRMWGTVGWMAVVWLTGYWLSNPSWLRPLRDVLRPGAPEADLSDAFRIGTVLALALACFSLALPRTPRKEALPGRGLATLAALRLLREPAFAVYLGCMLGACVTFPFTTQGTPLLLARLGVSKAWLGPTLTLSQVTEVLFLGLLPNLLLRVGLRATMTLGLCAWVGVFAVLSVGRPLGLVAGSQVLNGLFVAGFLVAGQVFVNRCSTGDIRASAQGLFSCVNGLGTLVGNVGFGVLRRWTGDDLPRTFSVGAALTLGFLILFLVGFRPDLPGADLDARGDEP